MYIYLDESGDLGFNFQQGSTLYFTIAVVLNDSDLLKRCVKKVKIKYKIPKNMELKGNTTNSKIKLDLLKRISKLSLEIDAITVDKENVEQKLRTDTNILYNYMVGLSLVERIIQMPKNSQVIIVVDRRITSITSGFKFQEYLRYKVWFEGKRVDIDLEIHQVDSHESYVIQGVDIISNSIFKKYNSNDNKFYKIISGKIKNDKKLFFKK
ncbi:MAG: hypothetical protein DDT41_00420 [candidate division WS2 bacterium]|nr:hypothetical protein [Candidatus Psychracetigena formicireducens]